MDWLQVAQLGHQAMTLEKGSSRQLRKGYFVENLSKHWDPDKSNIPLLDSPDRDSAEDWGHDGSQDNSSLTKSGKSSVNNVWGTPSRNFKKKPSCSSPQKPKTRDGRSPLLSLAKKGKNGEQLLINFGDESGRSNSDDETVVDNCDINKGYQKVASTKQS